MVSPFQVLLILVEEGSTMYSKTIKQRLAIAEMTDGYCCTVSGLKLYLMRSASSLFKREATSAKIVDTDWIDNQDKDVIEKAQDILEGIHKFALTGK